MLALSQCMTDHRREAGPKSHGERGDHEGDRKGKADGRQRFGAQHANKEGIDQVEGQNGDDAEDHGARHLAQYDRDRCCQHGIDAGQGIVSTSCSKSWADNWAGAASEVREENRGEQSKTFIVREKIFFVFALEGLATSPHIRDISDLAWNGHSSKQQ